MDKILIFIGVMVLAVLCGVFVNKARKFFSFEPKSGGEKKEPRLPAPDKKSIARQAQCRGILVSRGLREIALAEGGGDFSTHLDAIARLERWVFAQGIHTGFSPEELETITAAPGTWSPEVARQALRGAETLGCLCWALSLVREIPPYDEPFDALALLSYLHIAEENFDIENAASLRTFDVLLKERRRADLWRWRSRLQQKITHGRKPPRGFSYPQIISLAAKAGAEDGAFDSPVQEDFPAFGKAFGAMTPDEFARVAAVADMRVRALDWLCGYAPKAQ